MKKYYCTETKVNFYDVIFCNRSDIDNLKDTLTGSNVITFENKDEAIGCAKGLLIANDNTTYCSVIHNVYSFDIATESEELFSTEIIWEGYSDDSESTESKTPSCYS